MDCELKYFFVLNDIFIGINFAKMLKKINPFWKFIKNKYLIVFVGFLFWMMFFDLKDWRLLYARSNKLKALALSEQHLNEQIKNTKQELILLTQDAASIERYARENFYMKKDNEDLFIVKTP